MFYLETKDGDKFFTETDSDDRKEFSKIIFDKLGRDASDLFDTLVREDEDNAENLLHGFANRYKECINKLDKLLDAKELDKAKLDEVLASLQTLYLDYLL